MRGIGARWWQIIAIAMCAKLWRQFAGLRLPTEDPLDYVTDGFSLGKWYGEMLPFAEKVAAVARTQAHRMVFYHALQFALGAWQVDQSGTFWELAVTVTAATALLVISVRHHRATTFVPRMIRAGRLTEVSPAIEKRITRMVGNIFRRAATEHSVRLWIAIDSAHVLPSLEAHDGIVDLVMPLGFVKLSKERPDVAEAMLGHEVGHILQNDTDLLIFAEYAGWHARIGVLTILVLQVAAVFSSAQVYAAIPSITLGVSVLMHTRLTQRTRRASEDLADLAAVLFISNPRAYLHALGEYVTEAVASTHRPRAERIARVQNYIRIIEGSYDGWR